MSEYRNHEYHHDDFAFAHSAGDKLVDKNYKATSYLKDVWGNFRKNKGAIIGFVIVVIFIFMAIFGPSMNEHTYKSIIKGHDYLTPRIKVLENFGIFDGTYKGSDMYTGDLEDTYYWFGTDDQGRDLWTRVWSGTRV